MPDEKILQAAFPGSEPNDDLLVAPEQVRTKYYGPNPGEFINGVDNAACSAHNTVEADELLPQFSYLDTEAFEMRRRRSEAVVALDSTYLLSEPLGRLWRHCAQMAVPRFHKVVELIGIGR